MGRVEDMELYRHGQTVRFVGFGTPSQRQCLWVVDLRGNDRDHGFRHVQVHRQTDPDSIIAMLRKHITAATVLDLLVAD